MLAAALMSPAVASAAPPSTLAQMRWQQRVLLLFAPDDRAPVLSRQRAIVAAWTKQATDRDLVMVTVVGGKVSGAADTAAALRRRFGPAPGFTAILIGKDGGEKMRAAKPFSADTLQKTIDAMPMRQAGER